MMEIIKSIYQYPVISEKDLEKISANHHRVEVQKNEFLLEAGQTADCYWLLEKGIVRAFVHDYDNNEITTEFFVENEIVIVPSSLFQQMPSQENLQAVTDCRLLKIKYEDFQELYHDLKGVREWGRMWFSQQVFSMKQRSLDMITQPAKNRYLKLIKDKTQIIQNAPLKQIASYLGITDTSLSRIRKEILK